ncbi:WG repeat-containing protein [Mucilaginibacter rigui]|uniref:WG repeat-containing protein n=1 Tax=Mucilaginibacter rigui TaxID=534635 RepID=A0ABR7XA93_9SPHI|nr:WG repeat-containing protein [Mucilaginibacter rigui]MBD1387490.1 WG repeat-containing protein [Mucilaginibacter rigui]
MKRLMIALLVLFCACKRQSNNYLYRVEDTLSGASGYIDVRHDTVIPLGKYKICYTDTFKKVAFVVNRQNRLIAIDKHQNVLFEPYLFDNGPDYEVEGYYRIIKNNKLGYADTNGRVVIKPQFGCAYPFKKGRAKVSFNCKTVPAGDEHFAWESSDWFYIDKTGKRIN